MMLNVKKLKKRTLYLTITAVLSVAVISTSAAVWASSNTPKVVPHEEYEESHANVQPGEQVPEAAPYDAVAEKESNNIDPQQNQARTAPVAESESNNEAKGKESLALPKIETDSKKSSKKASSESAPAVSAANNRSSTVQTPSATTAAPKDTAKPEQNGPELQPNQKPAPAEDGGYEKSNPADIPPGTSITVRKLTPEESAEFKERELAARASLTPAEQAEFEEEDYELRPGEMPPGTSITVRKLTPEESAEFKERELAARALLSPEEQAEFED